MEGARATRNGRWAVGVLAVSIAGCSSPGDYAESRLLDLWDVLPVSARAGPGLKASFTATRFLGAGAGCGTASAVGLGTGRWGPAWNEGWLHAILVGVEDWHSHPPSWPGGPRRLGTKVWHDHGPVEVWHQHREFGRLLFVSPVGARPWGDEVRTEEPWHSWANIEADVFAGVGLRVGLCPDELVDFLAGLLGLDPVGDDIGGSTEREWARYWDFTGLFDGRVLGPGCVEYTHGPTGIVLERLPGGILTTRRPAEGEAGREGATPRQVRVAPFLLANRAVTRAQWHRVMGTRQPEPGTDDLPVEGVTLAECEEFCRRAGLVVPTEDQWEYASRLSAVETLGREDRGASGHVLGTDRWGGGAPPRGSLLEDFRPAFFPLPQGE